MDIIKEFVKERISIYEFSKKYSIKQEDLINMLKEEGFLYAKPKTKSSLIIDLKFASDEYLANDKIQAGEICKKYGLCHSTFSKYMKDYLGKPIKARPKSNFNDSYFDIIDSEVKAYLLGFFWADGSISSSPIDDSNLKNVYTIELGLKLDDIEILEKLKDELKSPRPIIVDDKRKINGKIYPRCRFLVNSKHMWNTLNNYGCTPRKSLTVKFPDESIFIESNRYSKEELIRHFIRGYFDGDGCISYANKEHTRLSIQLLGTLDFLKSTLTYLPKSLSSLAIRHNHNNPEESTRFISTSDSKAEDLVKYLYDDATIYLSRKYNRFLAHCYGNITNVENRIGESCDANSELVN